MIIGKVVGRIVSTRKHEKLVGNKFLVCEIIKGKHDQSHEKIVAIDTVGAGIGETVLIALGSSARISVKEDAPVDASVVGIIDEENDLGVYS
jgi:ethanolamine utilization protein EutN